MSPHPLHNILFLDIETVSQHRTFEEVPDEWKALWRHKAEILLKDKQPVSLEDVEKIYERSAIYAEFGKIICISCGIVSGPPSDRKLTLKSFSGDDEKALLAGFADLLRKWAPDHSKYLCAHNGREFDFPYLCRRMVIHGMNIPAVLNMSGRKPWEVQHIDTMELWKFGEYRSFVGLNLLAHTLGIPTPKDDIDGSQVGNVYWVQGDLPRIVTYCQKDVITVAQVYLRMHGESLIRDENIELK
ncbi:3'-5' exonuclease [Flavitalea sp. BT771]|uniref:3'-5' exonuclease n=1 Tax=Flavitalea sp. BT771 TaxID=3063329 RepID=UPI0026E1D6D4|nr:3'-5' exonuclease [Flavitalea sp. BT771]MDO6434451.1 3'-5' exonuclease [Flavitalea sp. BT771]MDV6223351.1 3'-5' exonuclease [Flavitalea sp. BT771]